MKCGVLTCLGSAMTAPILERMREHGLLPKAIIIDGRLGDRAAAIVAARLDRSFQLVDLMDMNVTDVPSYFVTSHNNPACRDLARSLELDYLVNAGTTRILAAPVLGATQGIVNCHPGMLPTYRGCTAVEWAIHNGDPVGATAHFMNEQLDEGPVIVAARMAVDRFDSYETIRTRMIAHQANVVVQALQMLAETGATPLSLPPQGEGRYYKPISLDLLLQVKAKLTRGDYSCS